MCIIIYDNFLYAMIFICIKKRYQFPFQYDLNSHLNTVCVRNWRRASFVLFSFLIEYQMPPQQPSQRNEIVEWYQSIPPITKALITLSIATTTVSSLGLVNPSNLILYWPSVQSKLQVNIK